MPWYSMGFYFAEIFFHFSEAEGDIELRPGDDVEFTIQTRNVSSTLTLNDQFRQHIFFRLPFFSCRQSKERKLRAISPVCHPVRLFSKTLVRLCIRAKFSNR